MSRSNNDIKAESELIKTGLTYEDIRFAVTYGSAEAVLEFQSLLPALTESMIRETFTKDNFFAVKTFAGRKVVLNATGLVYLQIIQNQLEEYGWMGQITMAKAYRRFAQKLTMLLIK